MTCRQSPAARTESVARVAESPAMSAYAEGLKAGKFRIQHCGDCRRHVFYPRVLCPHCASENLHWVEPRGTGTVYSTTIVRRPADRGGPYNVALIELDEGVRLMSRVDGLTPEAVRIGLRVQVHITTIDGIPAPVFAPASHEAAE